MGNYRNTEEKPERAYTGPVCGAIVDAGRRCEQPAYQQVEGLPLCDGHAESARIRTADRNVVQAAARAHCAAYGLDTPTKVRAEAMRLAQLNMPALTREWASRIIEREMDGEMVPLYASKLAADALR